MRAHTITNKARTIVPGGILALGLAVVLLAATASSASAERYLVDGGRPVASFDFGDRQVGTTSPTKDFALVVFDTFNPKISVSGDYAQTNDCPPTLTGTDLGPVQSCTINVTFTPTSTGPKGGTLSTGPGGPTVALTGTGVTTPTPPVLPLRVLLSHSSPHALYGKLWNQGKKLSFSAITNNDSTLVARGSKIKKTTKQVAAGEETKIRAKLKPKVRARLERQKRLKKNPNAQPSPRQARITVKATDEFDQTATDVIRFPQW